MDIGGLQGIQQWNQARNPFSTTTAAPGANSASGFEELLRRAQNPNRQAAANNQADEGAAPAAPRARNLPAVVQDVELYELCMELETILIRNMIRGMRNTIQRSNLIDTGFAGEIYEDMLWDEYASIFARNANLGFAEMAYRDLTGRR